MTNNRQSLSFRVSSGLKNIIGRDLISDKFIAIYELVKNSYDAGAHKVVLSFENIKSENASISIIDDGIGMSYDDIINKWLFVAYSEKRTRNQTSDFREKIKRNKIERGERLSVAYRGRNALEGCHGSCVKKSLCIRLKREHILADLTGRSHVLKEGY